MSKCVCVYCVCVAGHLLHCAAFLPSLVISQPKTALTFLTNSEPKSLIRRPISANTSSLCRPPPCTQVETPVLLDFLGTLEFKFDKRRTSTPLRKRHFQPHILEQDFLVKPLLRLVNPRRLQPARRHLFPSPGWKRRAPLRTTERIEDGWDWSESTSNTDFALHVNSVAFLPHLRLQRLTRHDRLGEANLWETDRHEVQRSRLNRGEMIYSTE